MKEGYGRGYYGAGQLAPVPRRSKDRPWVKWAIAVGVVGAGTAAWFLWPRKVRLPENKTVAESENPRSPSEGGSNPLVGSREAPAVAAEPVSLKGEVHPPPSQVAARNEVSEIGSRGLAPGSGLMRSPSSGRELFRTSASSPGTDPTFAQRAYEDGIVANARQLQALGNRVILAPHLAHLGSRINR